MNEDCVTDDKPAAATGGGLAGEGGSGEARTFREYMKQSFDLFLSKVFFYVVCYNFFSKVVANISTTAGAYVKKGWAGVTNLTEQVLTMFSFLVFPLALYQVKQRFLKLSWRKMLLWTVVVMNVTDILITYITIYDVCFFLPFFLSSFLSFFLSVFNLNFVLSSVFFPIFTFLKPGSDLRNWIRRRMFSAGRTVHVSGMFIVVVHWQSSSSH